MTTARSRAIPLRTLQSSGRRRRTVTLQKTLRKSFQPFAPLEVTLAFFDQSPEYYILSPFTRPTQQWLPSEAKIKMSRQRSSIDSLRRSVQFFIRLLEEVFLQYVTPLITIHPTATWISAVRL